MAVTLKDVAKKAGVGVSTVSYVLNRTGLDKVGQQTQKKILQVAKDLNYRPSTVARGLRTGHSFLIGVLISEITSSFVPELLQGIEEILLESHYGMLLSTYHTSMDMCSKIDFMLQKNIDAAIVLTDARKEYNQHYHKLQKSIPLVGIGEHELDINIPRVYTDGIQIGEIATEYLVNSGHTRIGCIGISSKRFEGIANTLEKYGIKLDEDLQAFKCNKFEYAANAVEYYLEKGKMPTAVICYSDEIAAGFIAAANKHGIKIPEDVSIIGVDDTTIAKMLTPALTTVSQPKIEQGEYAAKLAIDLIKQSPLKQQRIVLSPFIIERESCISLKQ